MSLCLLAVIQLVRKVPLVCPYLNAHVCAVPPQAPTLTMEGGRLKHSLQLVTGRDFETVPEPVWRALYHWYGANLSLPRPVSEYSTFTEPISIRGERPHVNMVNMVNRSF